MQEFVFKLCLILPPRPRSFELEGKADNEHRKKMTRHAYEHQVRLHPTTLCEKNFPPRTPNFNVGQATG